MARKKPKQASQEDLSLEAEDIQSESDLDMMTEERRIAEYQVEQDRDPGDWMANSIKDAAEMNVPDETLAGEEAIGEGAEAAIAQSALDLLQGAHSNYGHVLPVRGFRRVGRRGRATDFRDGLPGPGDSQSARTGNFLSGDARGR